MLSVKDIEVGVTNYDLSRYLANALGRRYYSQGITSDVIDLDKVKTSASDVTTSEEAAATAKYIIRSFRWASSFMERGAQHALDKSWDRSFSSAGITYYFEPDEMRRIFKVKREAVSRELSDYLEFHENESSSSTWHFGVSHKKFTSEHIGNPNVGILDRALWLARRNELHRKLNNISHVDFYTTTYSSPVPTIVTRNLSPLSFNEVLNSFKEAEDFKTDARSLMQYRSELLNEQTNRQVQLDRERTDKASLRFKNYWESLKARDSIEPSIVREQFSKIPLLPSGTDASRTWGIEIETVRAGQTERPPGWESKYDGSLPDSDGCDCSCDYCYDGCHDECAYPDDGNCGGSSREFVSPILSSYNSTGLAKLCADLGTNENDSEYCGIHVHVGASDLTVHDITRLLLSYSAIEPLFDPIYYRHGRNYCKAMPTDQLRWWLAKLREYRHANPDSVPTPSDILYRTNGAAPDRYVDVNLQALNAHNTIEFRAMGAWYNYDHLVRWAWIVRELVNVSKIGIDQREWTSCRSIDDVVAILRKYGTEMPSDQLFEDKSLVPGDITREEV